MRVVAIVIGLYLALAAVLVVPAKATRGMALSEWTWGAQARSVTAELKRQAGGGPIQVYTIDLTIYDMAALRTADQLALLIATYNTKPELREADLDLGSDCVFRSTSKTKLEDNQNLELKRLGSCLPVAASTPAKATLRVEATNGGRVTLWSADLTRNPYYRALGATAIDDIPVVYPIGTMTPHGEATSMTRVELLARVWDFGNSGLSLIVLLLVGSLACVTAGSVGLLRWRWPSVSGALCFFGICVCYVILVPPFQAPDEPDHFLTLADYGEPALAADALTLANRGQFERLKFRADEHIAVTDLTVSRPAPWAAHVRRSDVDRSHLAHFLWQKLAGLFKGYAANELLLLTRLFNSFFVAVCLSVGARLCRKDSANCGGPLIGILPFLWLPTLAFFSMHVSNYPFFIGGLILQACVVPALVTVELPSAWAFLSLGLGMGVAGYGAGPSGLVSLGFWGPLLICKIAAMAPGPTVWATIKRTYKIFAVLAGGYLVVAVPLMLALARPMSVEPLVELMARVGNALGCKTDAIATFAFLGLALTPVLTWVGVLVRRGWGNRSALRHRILVLAPWIVAALFFYSVFGAHSPLHDIEPPNIKPTFAKYAAKVVRSFLIGVGAGRSDGYIVQMFYGGFGWLETELPNALLVILRILPTAGTAALFSGLHFRTTRMRPFLSIVAFFSLLLYLVALAYGCHLLTRNLHGRYLIGLYLFYLELAFLWFFTYRDARRQELARGDRAAALFCCGFSHIAALIFLVDRYF